MLFRFLTPSNVKSGDITPPDIYRARRRFMQTGARLGLGAATLATLGPAALSLPAARAAAREAALRPLAPVIRDNAYAIAERPTSFKAVTTYNNFYEFGTGKEDPAENAHSLRPRPWTVTVDGHVEKPGDYDIDDLIRPHDLRERIYRMRGVEGWSMVIPWVGIPLGEMIRRLGPTAKARYVRFETLVDREQMPGQKRRVIDWPYVEGLRLDEAMHPLTLMAVGLYGKELPNQNGAPLRLVVPWKYGFKGIKSIVRISFTDRMPHNSWKQLAPHEYGFYANVNPAVAHPRWSQATERRIGEFRRRDTLMFNGYADEVAHLYAGMDLKKHF